MQRLAAKTALGLVVLLAAACGDDKKDRPRDEELESDGGILEPEDNEDETSERDPERSTDGGLLGMDASLLDASMPGARDADTDDEADAADGSLRDAGSDGGCDVEHPSFGCGRMSSGTWVRFDNGLEVDRTTGLGWSPTMAAESDEVLLEMCNELSLGGLEDFRIPEIRDVRTLAAGCPATLPESGACEVQEGEEPRASEGCSACDPAVNAPPHASGGYCRPEVPDCATLWTLTYCGANGGDCPTHEHWFYIPSTGAVELHGYGTEVAKSAKGRCVTTVPEPLP